MGWATSAHKLGLCPEFAATLDASGRISNHTALWLGHCWAARHDLSQTATTAMGNV
jgi:hypothetical protein